MTDLSSFSPVITGAVTAAVALVGLVRGDNRLRARLKADAQIVATLPEGPTRDRLIQHIEERVRALITDETTKSRDIPVLVAALLITPGLGALTAALIRHSTWWSYLLAVPAGVFTLVFVYGIFETGTKAERNEKGIRIANEEAKANEETEPG